MAAAAVIGSTGATSGSSSDPSPWTGAYTPPLATKCVLLVAVFRSSFGTTDVTASFGGHPMALLAANSNDGTKLLWVLNDPPVGSSQAVSIAKPSTSAQMMWAVLALNGRRTTSHTPVIANVQGFNNLSQTITPDIDVGFVLSAIMHENAVGPTPTGGQTAVLSNNGFGWARAAAYTPVVAPSPLVDSWNNGNLDHGSLMSTYLAFDDVPYVPTLEVSFDGRRVI
jgi:hypothetical protein